MVRLVEPLKVVTKDGEATVNIVLELNINVNTGQLSVSAKNEPKKEEENTKWVIPEFKSKDGIEFGKKVED